MVGCKSVVEYEKAGGPEQSMERHLPMFVSCQLTESLQRSITKVKRRREQEGSLKDKTKHLNQKKLVHPRRRRLQCPASAACICIAIDPAVESSDVHEFARMGGVMEEELEIQQDAIIQPLQVRLHTCCCLLVILLFVGGRGWGGGWGGGRCYLPLI